MIAAKTVSDSESYDEYRIGVVVPCWDIRWTRWSGVQVKRCSAEVDIDKKLLASAHNLSMQSRRVR